MPNKLDTNKMSDDDIQDMFADVYEKDIGSLNDIGSFECICKRETGNPEIRMEVMIVGMAGSPTFEEYKNGKVSGSNEVSISREGKGTMKFVLSVKDSFYLSQNDYVIVYKSV